MYWIPDYNTDTYLNDQKEWISKFLKYLNTSTGLKIWIDIGANKGTISEIIKQNSNDCDKIWLFEPAPDSYKLLCNKFKNDSNVKVWNLALSNYNGTNNFFINKKNPMSGFNFLEKSMFSFNLEDYDTVCSQVSALDNLKIPVGYQIPFIKIDAEGQDFHILQGASSILNIYRPYVLFEFSGLLGSDTFNFKPMDMYHFFKKHRYTLRSMIGGYDEKYIYTHYKINNPGLFDLLAVPDESPLD